MRAWPPQQGFARCRSAIRLVHAPRKCAPDAVGSRASNARYGNRENFLIFDGKDWEFVLTDAKEPEMLHEGLRLIQADVSAALDCIDDGVAQLVLTSPPYNLRKIYERDQAMSLDEYIAWLTPVVEKICTKVAAGGSVCWQVGNFVRDGEVVPLDYHFYSMFV